MCYLNHCKTDCSQTNGTTNNCIDVIYMTSNDKGITGSGYPLILIDLYPIEITLVYGNGINRASP